MNLSELVATNEYVANYDKEIGDLLNGELVRQRRNLELIASENIASPAVIACLGTVLTNKYAEGLPGKRYYGGCEVVDEIEQIAIDRAKELFGAEAANVQPHSGAQANLAVLTALLKPGEAFLGMDLANGGHLTHGSPANMSGKIYQAYSYGVDPETGRIDYEDVARKAEQYKPKLIIAGASSYPRSIDFKKFAEIAKANGAIFMVDMAHIAGLVAGGAHESPVPYADVVTTTTHKTLRGPRGGLILGKEEFAKKINSAVFPGMQGGPLMHAIAAKAICFREAMQPEFKAYAQQVVANAKALAAALKEKGFDLVSGGTDNHMLLADLRPLNITGKELQMRLDENYITVNKNSIPNDPQGPATTSGVRIGTPAATTRGMKEEDMREIAECIYLTATDFEGTQEQVRARVQALTAKYPIYE